MGHLPVSPFMGCISFVFRPKSTFDIFAYRLAIRCYIELRWWSIDDVVKFVWLVEAPPVKYWYFRCSERDSLMGCDEGLSILIRRMIV